MEEGNGELDEDVVEELVDDENGETISEDGEADEENEDASDSEAEVTAEGSNEENERSSDSEAEVASERNGEENEIVIPARIVKRMRPAKTVKVALMARMVGVGAMTRTWTRTKEMRLVTTCIAVVMTRVVVVGCLGGIDRPLEKNKPPDVRAS